MARSTLSPAQFADANSLENLTMDVDGESVTFILEKITSGKSRIRVCWNQIQVSEMDPNDVEYSVWDFDDYSILWNPAPVFEKDGVTITTRVMMTVTDSGGVETQVVDETTTRANIIDYISVNAAEILGYAKDAYYITKL